MFRGFCRSTRRRRQQQQQLLLLLLLLLGLRLQPKYMTSRWTWTGNQSTANITTTSTSVRPTALFLSSLLRVVVVETVVVIVVAVVVVDRPVSSYRLCGFCRVCPASRGCSCLIQQLILTSARASSVPGDVSCDVRWRNFVANIVSNTVGLS